MHELDDERPIPLGRAAAATPLAVEPVPRPVAPAPPATVTPPAEPPPRSAAHIERTRTEAASQPVATLAPPPEPVATAVAQPPVAPPTAATSHAASRSVDHPMAGLRGFRMEVQLAKPAGGGCLRDLGCFLAVYVVVAVLLVALIEGYLALSARVGSEWP